MIRGTATRVGRTLYLQDQTGAIEAVPDSPSMAEVGDELEITGQPALQGERLILQHVVVKDLWHSSAPPPLALGADEAANGEHSQALVQVEGRLLQVARKDGALILQLEAGHQFFSAALPGIDQVQGLEHARLLDLPINSTVRLTGVLNLNAEAFSATLGSFSLLLRNAKDVDVLRGPPWNTTAHIIELISALVMLGGLLQYAHFRSVRRHFRAILAERARIARDVHDTLAQSFAGIALQLEVVRGNMDRNPASAEAHLRTAVAMVRHCRAEAHRSISSMRAFSQPLTLPEMLRDMITSMAASSRVELVLDLQELRRTPAQGVAEQLFRICQEAASNAVQHAGATRITVALREVDSSLELCVTDNGCGFSAHVAADGTAAHFGILGMQERAAQLRAHWSLQSSNAGTVIRVLVPGRAVTSTAGRNFFQWQRPLRREVKL